MKNRQLAPAIISLWLLYACDGSGNNHSLVGQLESRRIELSAEVSEPVAQWSVAEGQSVAKGDLLVVQNSARIETRIAEAKAVLAQRQARLDELIRGPRKELILAAQSTVEGAVREFEFRKLQLTRAVRLLERNLASADRRDQAQTSLDAAKANLQTQEAHLDELLSGTTVEELRQARAAVDQSKAILASLDIDRSRHNTVAPVDGIVDTILFEPGERPQLGQPLVVMLSGDQPYARVFVPESMRVQITPGTEASITIDGLDAPLAGRVRWVSGEAAFTPYFALTEHDRGRLSFEAKVDILDVSERLPDGVPVTVSFVTGTTGLGKND